MRKIIRIPSLFILFTLIILTGTGCQSKTRQVSTTETEENVSGPAATETPALARKVDLQGIRPEYFAYNMSTNTMTLIERSENTYTLHRLQADGHIQSPGIRWHIPAEHFLDNFVHGSDGILYATLKHYNKKGQTRQSFVRLPNKGKYQIVKMHQLNTTPTTNLDSCVRKKGGMTDHSITDVQFCGTALSITYSNYAVKFYNIAEGLPLGDSHITGTAGRGAFFNSLFVSTGLSADHESRLGFYDIRTGEEVRSLTLEGIQLISNYRDTLYLLTKNGLYKGIMESTVFSKVSGLSELGLPPGGRVHRIYAARDHILYLTYQDSQAAIHLYRLDLV